MESLAENKKGLNEKVYTLLREINSGIDLTHELQTQINPEIFFKRNSVNLLIGKKGSGKTYNVFREILKLQFVPNHLYTKLIYVSDKAYDPTYERVAKVIKSILQVEKVDYAHTAKAIKRFSRAKDAQHKIVKKGIEIDDLEDDLKDKLKTDLDLKDDGEINLDNPYHTIVLLDDCQNMFEHKNIRNAELFSLLFQNRQPKITYFLTEQDAKDIDSSLKQNVDSVWVFGGFTERRFNYLMRDVLHDCDDIRKLWREYRPINKNQALILNIEPSGTNMVILKQ